MNRVGMIVDVSHVSDKTFYDTLAVTSKPVIASHSSCRALSDVPRNMTDEMIRALARNGGVIGINFGAGFVSAKDAAALRQRIGQAVATEPDLVGRALDDFARTDYLKEYGEMKPAAATLEDAVAHIDHAVKIAGVDHVGIGSDWDGINSVPAGLEDVSKMPALTAALLRRGYTEADVRKILGGNFLRVLREARRQFHFVPTAGPAAKQDLGSLQCLAVYPDGLLAEDWSARERRQFPPVYFVPFDGERLRLDDRILVVEAGRKSFAGEEGLGYPGEPYRRGDALVWVVDSTLHAFDLKSRDRKAVKLGRDLHASYRVTAFDGATVVCGVYAFDAASGALLGEAEYAKRPRNVASVIAARNAIGYYYESGDLRATDLAARDGASIRVRDAQPVV